MPYCALLMKRHIRPIRKRKAVYRSAKARPSAGVIVIIVLLCIISLTLGYLVVAQRIESRPEETVDTETEDLEQTQTETAEATETDGAVKEDISSYELIQFSEADVHKGDLIVINWEHPYDFSSEGERMVNLYATMPSDAKFTISSSSLQLCESAYTAFLAMTSDCFDTTGFADLMVTAAHRTKEEQSEHYEYWVELEEDKVYFELPGYSDHHTGLSFDLKIYTSDGASYSYSSTAHQRAPWIVENHAKYGFIMRYPAEKAEFTGIEAEGNHMRYVGVPHSVYMSENGLCLEEYTELIKSCTAELPLKIEALGKTYHVYGADISEGKVYVPSDGKYTISGDNISGVIVTVEK